MAEFVRKNPGIYGESKVEIIEINMQQDKTMISVAGKRIPVYPLKFNVPGEQVKCYAIIEKFKDNPVVLVDLLYGNIDLKGMEQNRNIRDRYLAALSRENIEMITRKRLGGLTPSCAIAAANAIKETAYSDLKVTTTQINNMFPNNGDDDDGKKKDAGESFFKLIMKFATRNNKTTPTSQPAQTSKSTGIDLPRTSDSTTHVAKEGILYYPAGAAIINGIVCSKFNYCTKDAETGERTEVDSFFVSGVDLEKLSFDSYYRKNFSTEICVPSRLKNTRGKAYPYIGCFNKVERFENDFTLAGIVHELREELDSKTRN